MWGHSAILLFSFSPDFALWIRFSKRTLLNSAFPSALTSLSASIKHRPASGCLHRASVQGWYWQEMRLTCFPPDLMLVFSFCSIRPEKLVSHSLREHQMFLCAWRRVRFYRDTMVDLLVLSPICRQDHRGQPERPPWFLRLRIISESQYFICKKKKKKFCLLSIYVCWWNKRLIIHTQPSTPVFMMFRHNVKHEQTLLFFWAMTLKLGSPTHLW